MLASAGWFYFAGFENNVDNWHGFESGRGRCYAAGIFYCAWFTELGD